MQSVIKRFAFMTLFLSLLIHAATFFPAWAASLPLKPLMLMHVAVLAAFICTVIMINQRPIPPSIRSDTQTRRELGARRRTALLSDIPWKFKGLLILALAYGAANFILSMANLEGGGPHMENGRHYLSNHGDIIRELSAAEYYQFQLYQLRLFSGFWILFSLASYLITRFGPNAMDRVSAEFLDERQPQ